MDWIEVTVKTTTEGADIVAQVFYEEGVKGVVVEDPNDIESARQEEHSWDYIDDSILYDMSEDVLVKAYLSNDAAFADKYSSIKEKIEYLSYKSYGIDMGKLKISLTSVCDEDWANNWKQYYKPMRVSERLMIKPSWEPLPMESIGDNDVVLEMDPGMAFGTGTHETTILCIEAIDSYLQEGAEVADIGCGTGILAISAVLLGAKKATAVDADSSAVKTATENVRKNHTADRVEVIQGNLLDPVQGPFDMIVANITADVVIQLADSVGSYLKPNGIFIASGIIRERLKDVVEAVKEATLEPIDIRAKGEWTMVVCKADA